MQSNNCPLITVAMVTYNSSRYLIEAIDSVLASDYSNFELLISDDCSLDNTWGIIKSYSDSRIIAVKQKKNIGEYNNRNYCLVSAKGKYIIYIDGDDIIYPHSLSVFVNELEASQECGMAISRSVPNGIKNILSPIETIKIHYLGDTVLNLALVRVCFNRIKFLSLGGFSVKYKAGDDYARLLMASHYPVKIVEDKLTWWRKSGNSASYKHFNSYSGVYEPLAIKYYFLNKTNLLSKKEMLEIEKKLNVSYKNILKSLIKKGNFFWFIRYLFDYKTIKSLGLKV